MMWCRHDYDVASGNNIIISGWFLIHIKDVKEGI